MNYTFNPSDQTFKAIKSGLKTVEGRTPRDADDKRFDEMTAGDTVTFVNKETKDVVVCDVLYVNRYLSTREMLEKEGIENTLPGFTDIEKGIELYNSIEDYEDRIKKYGIYAIGIKLTN